MISIIAAIGKNRELGKDNGLLWHLPEDLKRFKELTSGHPIIMGRKTFESIGRVLPNRLNVVITRDPNFKVEEVVVAHSLQEAIEASIKYDEKIHDTKYKIPDTDENEVFIIGGGQIFEQALPITDRLYLTIVDKTYDADTFFPEYSEFIKETERVTGKSDGLSYTYLTLEKST